MGTEDELRERVRLAVRKVRYVVGQRRQPSTAVIVDAAFDSLGIPLPVLAWITANPEAAKGLASGEMVAAPKLDIRSPSTIEELEAILNSEDTAPVTITADGRVIAAASPEPSAKARGDDATEETPSCEVDRVLGKNVGAMK